MACGAEKGALIADDGRVMIRAERDRHPAEVMIADVLSIYAEDVAPHQERPREVAARLGRLVDFFGTKRLDQLNAKLCAAYVAARGSVSAARRELEDLRSAVRHHWKAGMCLALTPVVLPERGESRVRWLRREEAARLLLAAYRYREVQKGCATGRRALAHVARFILVGRVPAPSAARRWSLRMARVGSILKPGFSIGARSAAAKPKSGRRRLGFRRAYCAT
jgi:hypothetical protein